MNDGSGESKTKEVEARLRLAQARSGRQLTEQELALLRDRTARQMELARLLRAVPLDNGDEPAHVFNPATVAIQDATKPTS